MKSTKKGGLKELGIKKIGEEEMGICEYRLKNGLKVLLSPNHSAPVVTYMQLFRVGSRDEGVGNTGATHFLEHMMFKGTRKFDPQMGLDSTELFNRIGAVSNATTWFDRTNYFEAVPSEYLEFCIKVEADRMRNLRLRQSDRDAEMSVVRNELERGENSPDEALEKEMYAIAYREHPYHHPTIGWRSDVENVPMTRLKEFYDTFYWPNNCTVIIVGDFDTEKTLRLIHKYYGKIPASPKPIPEVYTIEPAQEGERRYQISRSGDLMRVWVGHRTPSSSHPDHYPLNVISHLLGGSHDKSSRLYKALIDSGLAMDVACRHDELRDPALIIIAATLTPQADAKEVEERILAELEKLKQEEVTLEELAPIKSANYKGSILARADQMELAFAIGEAEARADWRWLAAFDEKFEAVNSKEIIRVASEYFDRDNRTVGYFYPAEIDEDESGTDSSEDFEEEEILEEKAIKSKNGKSKKLSATELEKVLAPAKSKKRASFAEQVSKEVLANGLRILHMQTPGTGSVSISINLPAGNYFEPGSKHGLADVTAEMISRGTQNLSKEELARKMKEMGLLDGLNIHSSGFYASTSSTVVKEDLEEYLRILSQVLRKPLFQKEELNKLILEWSARIQEQKNNTSSVAANRLYQELYPSEHLFHHIEFDRQLSELQNLKAEDLASFHSYFSPASSVITVVGDVEKERAFELLRSIFADWTGINPGEISLPAAALPGKTRKIEISMPDKASMDILMGHPLSIKRSDPEYYPLFIANLALGGDTIISRLGKVVREEHGLTYGIYSGLGDNSFGAAPWTISLSVNPANASKALSLVSQILEEYKKKGITSDELRRESSGAAGLFKVSLRSSAALAKVINRFETLGLGLQALDEHSDKILAVKKSEVDEVIRKHLHPEQMLTVLAGTF